MRFDDAFANSKYLADGKYFPSRWEKKATEFRDRQGAGARLSLRYGTGERHWFDLFLPNGTPRGLMIFVHGGYWLAFGPRDFSHLAEGALARGWACAMPAYTLAPAATIPAITAEIAAALSAMAAEVAGPIAITGHSAGGHLTARMACASVPLGTDLVARIRRYVPISPLSDLRPLMETEMQNDLKLTPETARVESAALQPARRGARVHVWVGRAERPRFLDQARRLGNGWSCQVTVEPDLHHFNIIEGLERADSPLMQALLE